MNFKKIWKNRRNLQVQKPNKIMNRGIRMRTLIKISHNI